VVLRPFPLTSLLLLEVGVVEAIRLVLEPLLVVVTVVAVRVVIVN
jgi:hypothetical protein